MLEAALEYYERGWVVIPIRPDTKKPAIKWAEYQERQPTEEEIERWWGRWPDAQIALVTGDISGVVVVDCDNTDAEHAALDYGMTSPIKVQTKNGRHYYFLHPRDGVRRGPRAGVHTRGEDWPKVPGLDFRGDGSYALLPPSPGYSWDYPAHDLDWDDAPIWQDWRPKTPLPLLGTEFDFGALDLSSVTAASPDDLISEWDRTAKYVRERFPTTMRIPTGMGNGRNERVMRFASECILDGTFGAELRVRCHAFQNEFFEHPLSEAEFEATVASMEEAERRNHPERFDEEGRYIFRSTVARHAHVEAKVERPKSRFIQQKDAAALIEAAGGRQYMIEPWLPPATIVQVFGYSGHGKSLFVQHAMGMLAAGKKYYGPFEIHRTGRVLYMDWEMGPGTVGLRLQEMEHYGDMEDRLNIWAPWIEDTKPVNLRTAEGAMELQALIHEAKPDVVVLDTVRSAYSGLEENKASEWAQVNELAMRLRNAGLAVILIHHANKPGEQGIGREAGSSNQLTVLETQIRVAQVFTDKEDAQQKAGLWDGDYEVPVWPQLEDKMGADWRLQMVMEIRYGKVREWTDVHDPVQWIGFAAHDHDNLTKIVSSRSSKQRAKDMRLSGLSIPDIATKLGRPQRIIKDWIDAARSS